jgi:hypothetical protein
MEKKPPTTPIGVELSFIAKRDNVTQAGGLPKSLNCARVQYSFKRHFFNSLIFNHFNNMPNRYHDSLKINTSVCLQKECDLNLM